MNDITIEIVKKHIPFVWAENSFSSYTPGIDSAKLKLHTYVGAEVMASEEAAIVSLVEAIVVKDAFVIAAPTLAVVHSGNSFLTADDQTSKPATPEQIAALAKSLRHQVRITMNALLLQLEKSPIEGWENSQSYCLIPNGILPNLTALTSICNPPAVDKKYKWMDPTRMDFARHWKPQLQHHQHELEKYFGKAVVQAMLDDDYEELRQELREILVEYMWGQPAKAQWRRDDLMRMMAENVETYSFIADTDVYTQYIAALDSKHTNSADSSIYVGG